MDRQGCPCARTPGPHVPHSWSLPPVARARSLLSESQAVIKTSSEQIWGQRDPITLEVRTKSNASDAERNRPRLEQPGLRNQAVQWLLPPGATRKLPLLLSLLATTGSKQNRSLIITSTLD